MERITGLNKPMSNEKFMARGEKIIGDNILSYDIQNGIASFRFIKRSCRDNFVVEAISGKWSYFEEYKDREFGVDEVCLENSFYALLEYGYSSNGAICFYVDTIIVEAKKSNIFTIDVFSPCLINHFESAETFDFNSTGYVEDNPCAVYKIKDAQIKVFRTVAVEVNRNKVNYKFAFPKLFVGGFRFESNKPFTNDVLKHCVDAVNNYCCFLLKDGGFFISQVEIVDPNDSVRNYIYYPYKSKEIETEILFRYDDISTKFSELMGLFFEQDIKFNQLYVMETNVYKSIDILRIASMFENQYRKNIKIGMNDYVAKENEYKEAYNKIVEIKEANGELENSIRDAEIVRYKNISTTLKMKLDFVFGKLLSLLGTSKEMIEDSMAKRMYNYDISNLADIIKNARNDIAHNLGKNIDYKVALFDTHILQLMIYYMVFERIGLPNEQIKKIILGYSRYSDWVFGIKKKK